MKTMKDFKGTADCSIRPCANGGVILHIDKNQQVQIVNPANARLFANSKKVLMASIDALRVMLEVQKERGHGFEIEILNLQQAINDSL